MPKTIPSLLFCFLLHFYTVAQIDGAGSGRAFNFDGVNDYVDMQNIYDDIQFPITISAWVYKSPSSFLISPIFASQDNAAIYNGFWFCLSQTNLFFEYGDGRGEQNGGFRRGKSAPITNIENRWMYVSAVVKGRNDIELFVNGKNVGGEYTGTSDQPMASNYPTDVAKIGYFYTNSVTHRFKGSIDELRIWNRALTEAEIRESMCRRLKGDEAGLIGYWNFDETSGNVVYDKSSNQFHGTVIGNAERVYSGAPVGDESAYLYTSSWAGKELSKADLRVSNIKGTPYGVHIYSVNSQPSQTGGLPSAGTTVPYYGVFLADDSGTNTFDFSFSGGNAPCNFFQRNNNSEPDWRVSESFANIYRRIEIIPGTDVADLQVAMGPDLQVCDQSSYYLQSNSEGVGRTFLWNTGATTANITVGSSGEYWVQVREGCKMDRDTIRITMLQKPGPFSLGPDESFCAFTSKTLSANLSGSGYTYEWHDGSSNASLVAQDFGTYWLRIRNACGSSADSVMFTRKIEPDFTVDLGADKIVCNDTKTSLQAYPHENGKRFLWSNGATTHTITVNSPGVYSVQVSGECRAKKDTIHVSFASTPSTFSLGTDESLCAFKPRILSVDPEEKDVAITWSDGSSEKYFLAETFGTYWVKIQNVCGVAYDSITFTQIEIEVTPQYNFISPDTEDEYNQVFMLDENLAGLSLTVFNRWGKKVYHSPRYDNSWSGSDLPAGVYYYVVSGGCIEPYKGSLTIMR